jgi:hypothetical protein
VRTSINKIFLPHEKGKNLASFFSSSSHITMNVVPDYNHFSFPDVTWHNSFLYEIWGEIGKKLGGKNINKNILIYSDKKVNGGYCNERKFRNEKEVR